ncbi:TRAP transporter large permease [Faecalicatena sp. AGMB00832]|uniref:TRAP transporter large permease n=1 Tax=Faecalicatena faecalis TaxID=2726362 RepID=A0ABS6CZP6_9FIRM|nr:MULTISPECIES: TRAP transporter large permease [Faecalicatena]MBU3874792.1 TRAP transporter large permease [Faecalicatena faecalis]MCI6465839.1 TRAP transporter large permease [Faecalicatena sp.]MDY5618745.1 TRAP transporter large permease [Lachnospiraceae bacterium]
MSTLLLYLGIFAVFFVVGVPIVLSLSLSAIILLYFSDVQVLVFAHQFIKSMDNYSLTAIFFFILAGEIMNSGGMTKRIIAAVSKKLGNVPGGLAMVAGVSAMIFAAINGSAIATAAAIGAIMIPAMQKQKYDSAFSGAVVAAGGVVGPIIPPSIPVILYGSITGAAIPSLFMGGMILGILITAGHVILSYIIGKKRGYYIPKSAAKNITSVIDVEENEAKGVIWALLLPVFIMVTIVAGIFTATEAAAFSVVYAFIISKFVYKELKMKNIVEIFEKSMKSTGTVMAIVGSASAVAWVLTYNRVPQQVADYLLGFANSQKVFMLIVFVLLIVVGMIMDLTPAILILAPIFIAPVAQYGIDPVYFGVIFLAILTTGLITPPVGTLIFTACSMTKRTFSEVSKELIPYTIVTFIIILLAVFIPQIITFLPNLLYQ